MRRFLLVGLTGSIATGKSTVSRMFAHLGARVLDADLLAREVVMPGQPAYLKIVEEFGQGVVQEDGTLDRKALGAIVFAEPARPRCGPQDFPAGESPLRPPTVSWIIPACRSAAPRAM